MNRLIIIGNGFDIAHGLKTKYCDFVKSYWNTVHDSRHDDWFFGFNHHYANTSGYPLSINKLQDALNLDDGQGYKIKCEFKNHFFKQINTKYEDVNWVNIEMEYYKSLKKILKAITRDRNKEIKELNRQVREVIGHFEKYMVENVLEHTLTVSVKEMHSSFSDQMIGLYDINRITEGMSKLHARDVRSYLREKYRENRLNSDNKVGVHDQTYILNFNYTVTFEKYINPKHTIINIHGELNNPENPINMGFGDEMDASYPEIENMDDNEFLRFIKSFHYLNTSDYSNLLSFLQSDIFQVELMGHSCGLSDRTLLNTIFEHENCASIQVHYHKYEDDNPEKDDFSDVIKNISRHFKDKKLMRAKIVNKQRCKPLPQKAKSGVSDK